MLLISAVGPLDNSEEPVMRLMIIVQQRLVSLARERGLV
jgi:hypothetical protein